MIPENLNALIEKHLPEVIVFRHELHKIPEIAGKEFKTAAFIRERLSGLNGIRLFPPFLETDVSALIGDPARPNLTLRADIDALPLEEAGNLPYRSRHPGFMHACGHDGHSAILYGTILCLLKLRERLGCSVRFLFQPGEEVQALARKLVEAGALENPRAGFVAGLHNWPGVPWGTISARTGAVMAAAGFFRIEITGRGGHGSMPQKAKNPLETAAKILLESKKIIPDGCVLSVCSLNGGNSANVIPDQAVLTGTVRFQDSGEGEKMNRKFHELCSAICAEDRVRLDFRLDVPYPPTVDKAEGYRFAKSCATEYLGKENFTEMPESSMSSEDFAYYLLKYSGVFCHLGTGTSTAPLHSSQYDFDDDVLANGIKFFLGLALSFPDHFHAEAL